MPSRTLLRPVSAPALFALFWLAPFAVIDASEPIPPAAKEAAALEPIDFARDVRPILARHCFECHGPGAQKAGLRLDDRERAISELPSGARAIVPERAEESRLLEVIRAGEGELRMPPEGPRVEEQEIAILERWISAGAPWAKHWAFEAPRRPKTPNVSRPEWPKTALDRFVLARLDAEGLAPSPEADRRTLARRTSFDLRGLPPTPEEIEAFIADERPDAYERWVEELLESPAFGERWARWWLDAARYSDTNGYEKDRERSIWPWRDWVIRAFNSDKRFDAFTIEQLAGDLLPGATLDQVIATGFHRNTMTNEEGGVDVEEFRFESIIDRVHTTATTFLGLTASCAQCHDHKYDPWTQEEYWRFFAFLNNDDEPEIEVFDPAIARAQEAARQEIAALEKRRRSEFPVASDVAEPSSELREEAFLERFAAWVEDESSRAIRWEIVPPARAISRERATMQMLDDGSVLVRGDLPNADAYEVDLELDPRTLGERVTAIRLEVLPHESLPDRGPGRAPLFSRGDFLLSEIEASVLGSGNGNENESGNESANASARPLALRSATTDFAGAGRAAEHTLDGRLDTGWSIQGATGRPHRIVWELAEPLELEDALRIRVVIEQRYIHQMTIGRFRFAATSAPTPVVASPHPHEVERALAYAERGPEELALLEERFLDVAPELAAMNAEIAKLERSMPRFPTTLVLEERTLDPRTTRLRHRGEFLQPRHSVEPGVPEFLHPLPDGAPRNRLGLARWIVDERNPLFARVIANRVWQAFFGRGIVETTGDFGIRGALPSHPELLDHLAIELRESGYGFKSLLRTIVLSATYRQSSHATPELLSRDPENRLFARGPRFRLPAEMIRDGALLAAGLLDERIGGPSVYPPLPEGVADLAWGGYRWPTSKGADRYRRSLYTFAKRTVPHPVYTVFDAPPGDVCEVRRGRSNTPLQALTLLSDAIYVEAARALAARVLEDSGPHATVEERVTRLFILVYGRSPDREELELIEAWGERQIERLKEGGLDARKIAGEALEKRGTNDTIGDSDASAAATAAFLTLAARAILNTDEAITKP